MSRKAETEKRTIKKQITFSSYELNGSLKDIADKIDNWRKEYGDDATFNIEYHHSYYDTIEVEIEINYTRLETDEEVVKRIERSRKARETAKKNRAVERERKAEQEKKDLEKLVKKHPELAKKFISN